MDGATEGEIVEGETEGMRDGIREGKQEGVAVAGSEGDAVVGVEAPEVETSGVFEPFIALKTCFSTFLASSWRLGTEIGAYTFN